MHAVLGAGGPRPEARCFSFIAKNILAFQLQFIHGESRHELVVEAIDANRRRQNRRVGLRLFDDESGQRSDRRDSSKPFVPAVWKRG
jgi:hypothetical protein